MPSSRGRLYWELELHTASLCQVRPQENSIVCLVWGRQDINARGFCLAAGTLVSRPRPRPIPGPCVLSRQQLCDEGGRCWKCVAGDILPMDNKRILSFFFFSSTYLCGKISTFTIYSFSVFTQHVICWLWNSLIWIVEEKEGEFSEISIYYSWCLERCVGLCFFTNEKIILIETKSGSKLCWFQRVQPFPRCHLADTILHSRALCLLPSTSQFFQDIKRGHLTVSGTWHF